MFGALHVRRIVPFVLVAVLILLFPALLIVAQEPIPTPAAPEITLTPAPWAIEPAVAGAHPVSTPTPTSPFELLFTDSFDDENYTANFWTFGAGWEQSSSGGRGQAFEVSGSEAPMTYLHSPLADVMAEAWFQIRAGAARLIVRESSQGSYALQVDNRGQVSLYRGETILASDTIGRSGSGQWHTLRLAALGNTLRVWVDDDLLIETQDSNPLPAGAVSFAARDLGDDILRVDDFSLWVPTEIAPTATATISAADLPAEPQLYRIFEDTFGDASLTAGIWTLNGWERGLFGDEWVLGSTGGGTARFASTQLGDFAVHLRFQATSSSAIQVHVRQGEAGAYTVVISPDGRISLRRGSLNLGEAQLASYTPDEWHVLWYSVIDGVIRVGIDYEQVIAARDASPLPPGAIVIEGSAPIGGALLVDDFELWIPVEEDTLPASSSGVMAVTESTGSLYWNFAEQGYNGWYSGSPGSTGYWDPSSPFYYNRDNTNRCEYAVIDSRGEYEGLTAMGWYGGVPPCSNGYALNGVRDLGQSYLVSSVSYGRYTVFEGLGRWYTIRLLDENYQTVPGPIIYTIAGTGYGTHTHTLATPSYVRYVQVLGQTAGSRDIIFTWVQLNYTAPTPTPTPTQLPITATCPTTTGSDATIYAGPDLSSMPVNTFLTGTGIDLMGLYINGGWYAVQRYTPEGSGMSALAMMSMSIAPEGWIRAEDVVLTGEGGLPLPCLVDIPYVDENGNIVEGTPTPTPSPSPTPEPLPTCAVHTLHDTGDGVNMRPEPGDFTRIVHTYITPTNLTAQGWREDAIGEQWIHVWDPDNSLYGWIRNDLLAGLILTADGGCADLRRVTPDSQAEDPFDSPYDYHLPNPELHEWSSPYTCSSEDSNEAREGCAQAAYAAFYDGLAPSECDENEMLDECPMLSDLLNRILRLELGVLFEQNSTLGGRVLKNNYWQFAHDYECDEANPCSEEVIVSLWLSGVQSLYKYGNPNGSGVGPGFDEWLLNPPRYQMGAMYALSDNFFEGCLGGGGTGPCEWGNYGFIDNNIRPPDLPNTYQEIVSEIHANNTFYCQVRRAYFDNNLNGGAPNPTENDVWVDEIFAVTGPTVGKTWTFEMLINGQLNQPPWLLVTTKETVNGRLITTYGAGYRRGAIEEINTNAVITPCPANAE